MIASKAKVFFGSIYIYISLLSYRNQYIYILSNLGSDWYPLVAMINCPAERKVRFLADRQIRAAISANAASGIGT